MLTSWLAQLVAAAALSSPPGCSPPCPDGTPGSGVVVFSFLVVGPAHDAGRLAKVLNSLQSRDNHLPQPNGSCNAILCFCGIRLHQITSLSCPAAFNVSSYRSAATPMAALKRLEHDCRNSSYAGCTRCLESLEKLKGDDDDNRTEGGNERTRKMFSRDCQLMGLTWLLARNKTAYIPTVSAVLRAVMYTTRPPHQSKCSPDQENMPLAVDSLQFHGLPANPAPPSLRPYYFSLLPATLSIIIPPFLLHLSFSSNITES